MCTFEAKAVEPADVRGLLSESGGGGEGGGGNGGGEGGSNGEQFVAPSSEVVPAGHGGHVDPDTPRW